MTNVKLKLMFALLNALLTDPISARPYENTTDLVVSFSNQTGGEFNIPVAANADTLTVVTEETQEQTNKNSKTEMEAIVNAEQDRDEGILKKKIQKPPAVLESNKEEAASIEKQLNSSSPSLDDMMDAEQDRDETLTDHRYRQDAEFVEGPKFEFLISGKINGTQLVNVSEKNGSFSDGNIWRGEFVELVAVGGSRRENSSAYLLPNITGHELENDVEPDTSYTDLQTLFLACFATLLPLMAVLFATLFVRCLCRRCCPRACKKPLEESTSASSEHKEDSPRQQLKSIPEQTSETEPDEADAEGEGTASNGSIITMTLKNNHLIVETEERNDITRNGRETKMKYSPDNEGIFVVEVQQSAVYRPNREVMQHSPPVDPQISTNQALVHRVECDHGEDDTSKLNKAKSLALSSTGLSISDLSMSSVGSHNASYSYGSQTGYEHGPFGYPLYAGYDIPKDGYASDEIIHENSREPLITKTPTDPDRPVVTAAIFKQDSIIGTDALQGPGYSIEGSTDGPLLSDVQAREVSLQHLHDEMEKKLENGNHQEVKESLKKRESISRADSLPMSVETEHPPEPVIDKNDAMETIMEDELISKEMFKGKRASLPIIRTEMYDSVKEALLTTGSPKFEKFSNDISPVESILENPPPMITITEEVEVKSENGSS